MKANTFDLQHNNTNLFAFRNHNQYSNFYDLFLLYFGKIPSSIQEETIDCKKGNEYFKDKYKDIIIENFYRKEGFNDLKKLEIFANYYVLDKNIIVFFVEHNETHCLFAEEQAEKVNTIILDLLQFRKKQKEKRKKYLC
jgi:predicted membrane-bound dolichyl-phosphate-mannose-protein mannosyltransferase